MAERQASVSMYQFVNAVEEMIRSSDFEKRQAMARTVDAFHNDYPEEFNLATSGQAPALLHNLMLACLEVCWSRCYSAVAQIARVCTPSAQFSHKHQLKFMALVSLPLPAHS